MLDPSSLSLVWVLHATLVRPSIVCRDTGAGVGFAQRQMSWQGSALLVSCCDLDLPSMSTEEVNAVPLICELESGKKAVENMMSRG